MDKCGQPTYEESHTTVMAIIISHTKQKMIFGLIQIMIMNRNDYKTAIMTIAAVLSILATAPKNMNK